METGTKTTKKDSDKVAALKGRVLALRPMPLGWRKKFVECFPEFDTLTGFNKLGNVATCKVLDESIIKKLETLFGKK